MEYVYELESLERLETFMEMTKMGLKLCGGIFFSLFLEAKKDNLSANEHFLGKCSELNEKEAYKAFAMCVQPDLGRYYGDMKDVVSSYKKCTGQGGDFFPFANSCGQIEVFDERVRNNYSEALRHMCIFVHDFMKYEKTTRDEYKFVARMLDLIDKDESIKPDTLFYVKEDGTPVNKAGLFSMKRICLQSFMLGVLHCALMNSESNRDGEDTFNCLFPAENNTRRRYKGGLDESRFMPQIIYLCDIPENMQDSKDNDIDDDSVTIETPNEEPSPEQNLNQQIINQNPFFLNVGGSVGTINYGVNTVNNYYNGKVDENE